MRITTSQLRPFVDSQHHGLIEPNGSHEITQHMLTGPDGGEYVRCWLSVETIDGAHHGATIDVPLAVFNGWTHEAKARVLASMEEGVSVTAGTLNTESFFRRVEDQRETQTDQT